MTRALAIALLMVAGFGFSQKAQAVHRNVRTVMTTGAYGIVGGTLVGLATVPMSKDFRTMFIGSSVGLYLGIAVGIYYILHRDDPTNPLRSEGEPRWALERERLTPNEPQGPLAQLAIPVFRF